MAYIDAADMFTVDAFTAEAFAGNPAAVCLLHLGGPPAAGWMQKVAREMNLSETAFVRPVDGRFELRWFTPAAEVDLCGHATLAAAHAMWEAGWSEPDRPIRFETRSGPLGAARKGEWIELDFPAEPARPLSPPEALVRALGVSPVYVGRNRMDYLVEVDAEATLRGMSPDMRLLKTVVTRGVIVTSRSDARRYDFVSRFFAPALGIDEDPVTGSAHCCLAPFWHGRTGRNEFLAYQASARGGVLKVTLAGDRVRLGGQAVTVLRGELVPPLLRLARE